MKKIIIILLSLFIITSCDYVEINDLVIITGVIIDYKDDMYEITSQIIENENETKVKVFTTRGTSIEECLKELSKLSNKDLFISHLKVLILTENTINNNNDYQDYFLRESKSKMNFYVYFIDSEYKDEILSIYENEASSLYIKDLMDFNNKIFSSSTPLSFLDLIYKQKEYGIDEVYPNIMIKENNDKKVLYLQNIIMFNSDNKKITLDDKEGVFFNMITNNLKRTSLNIPCDNDYFSMSINSTNTDYKWTNNTFYINTKVKGKLSSYECSYDLDKPNTTQKLSSLVNTYIKDNINDIVNISVKEKIDFLGMGNYIYRHDKKYFDFKKNEWNNSLSKLNIKINVDTTISSIGEMRK